MSCTPPARSSPGFLRLDYIHTTQSLPHSTRSRLMYGVDPLDVGAMLAAANAWAAVWKAIVTSAFVCNQFSVLRHDGSLIYSDSLSATVTGVHAVGSGAGDYASRTLCFTGRGVPALPSECTGEELHRVFVGAAFEFVTRQKFMVPGADAGVDAYASFLNLAADIWADSYGNKAGVRGRYPIQFNAYAQGRNGT